LEGGPEITGEASLAGLAVIEKKPVDAAHAIVVKVMNHGNAKRKRGGVDGGGKSRENIVDQPEVKMAQGLIFLEPLPDRPVGVSAKRSGHAVDGSSPQKLVSGAEKILHLMVLLKSVPDPVNGVFLAADLRISVENLEDAKPSQVFQCSVGETNLESIKERSGW
jgi:hypothetical protein